MRNKLINKNALNRKTIIRATVTIIAVFILTALMFLNMPGEDSISFDLSSEIGSGYARQWSPHLTLPKGEYMLSVSGVKSTGDEPLYLVSSDGTKYAEFSGTGTSFTLEHDVTELILSTDDESANVRSILIKSDGRIFGDVYLLALLLMLGLILLVYCKWFMPEDIRESAMIYLALIAIGIFATYPYFASYLQSADDLSFHLARIEGIKDGLLCGQFPVRIDPSSCSGYGYPTGIFYGNLFLYFPAVLRLCGVSAVTAYKTMCLGVNIATALIAYYSIKGISKSRYAGFIGAVIYTLSTWRIICMVSRAAVGESLSMMILPLVILGVYQILYGDKNKWYILAIGFTGLIQTHVINTLIAGLMTAFIVLCSVRELCQERRWLKLLKAAGLTVLLNMWFIVPFITAYTGVDMNLQHSLSAGNFQQGAIIPAELFNVFNNKFGVSNILSTGIMGDMSLSLGILPTLGMLLAVFYIVFAKNHRLKPHKMFVILFVFTAAVLYMSTSLFPWDYLRDKFKAIHFFENTLQFPWRFLTIASLILSFLTALLMGLCNKNLRRAVAAVICVIGVLGVVMFGSGYTEQGSVYAVKGQSIIDSISLGATGEYLPQGKKSSLYTPEEYNKNGSVKIEGYEKNGTNITLALSEANSGDYIELPLLYYPGYTAKDNNGGLKVVSGSNGVVRIILNHGSQTVKVKYSGLISYTFGNIITLLTLMVCILWRPFKKRYKISRIKTADMNGEDIDG